MQADLFKWLAFFPATSISFQNPLLSPPAHTSQCQCILEIALTCLSLIAIISIHCKLAQCNDLEGGEIYMDDHSLRAWSTVQSNNMTIHEGLLADHQSDERRHVYTEWREKIGWEMRWNRWTDWKPSSMRANTITYWKEQNLRMKSWGTVRQPIQSPTLADYPTYSTIMYNSLQTSLLRS